MKDTKPAATTAPAPPEWEPYTGEDGKQHQEDPDTW
jgi:hypothetical protein